MGIKFVDLTEEEQAYLESHRELQAAWQLEGRQLGQVRDHWASRSKE